MVFIAFCLYASFRRFHSHKYDHFVLCRWEILRTYNEWWFDHFDIFFAFLRLELQRSKDSQKPKNVVALWTPMQEEPAVKKAMLVFVTEHSSEICSLINMMQMTTQAVAVVLADHLATLTASLKAAHTDKTLHPCVVEFLQLIEGACKIF